ncbi:MAG: TonB C-terminal domain-containing protein [bacterium]
MKNTLLFLLLCATPALAADPADVEADELSANGADLYWARLSLQVSAQLPPGGKPGLTTKVKIRLDGQGALTAFEVVAPSGDAAFDAAVAKVLDGFKPTGKERFAVALDPAIRARVDAEGVTLELRAPAPPAAPASKEP